MKRFCFGAWLLLMASPALPHRAGPTYQTFKWGNGTFIVEGPARNGKTSIVSRHIRLTPAPLPRGIRIVKPRH